MWIPQNTGFSESSGGKAEWYPGSLPWLGALAALPSVTQEATLPDQASAGAYRCVLGEQQ